MPYEWQNDGVDGRAMLRLWPHRSLPRRGFAALILGAFTILTIPLYPLLGTFVLWGLLPFLLLVVAGLWWALERSYRSGEVIEELTITPQQSLLCRTEPDGRIREWSCNSYWARVKMHPKGGPVPFYVTLKGGGREVEVGAFLSEDERKALFTDIEHALNKMCQPNGGGPD